MASAMGLRQELPRQINSTRDLFGAFFGVFGDDFFGVSTGSRCVQDFAVRAATFLSGGAGADAICKNSSCTDVSAVSSG
jgi:hypothetical protein